MIQPAHRQTDLELTRLAAQGSDDARRRLAERVLDRIRTTVRFLGGEQADAADCVQLSLVEVLRSAHTFRGESRLETWVDRIAVRTTLRELKQRRRTAEKLRELPPDPAPASQSPESALDRARVQERLARLLQKLTPARRSTLVLQIVYGYSIREIAELTDVPLETVRDRLKVGKKQLRRLVQTDDALRDWAKDRRP